MLYWATKPDSLLGRVVHEALELAREFVSCSDGSSLDEWQDAWHELAKFFNPSACLHEIEKLRSANGSDKVLRPGDYHYLFLYEVLKMFCEAYNDKVAPQITHRGTPIWELDFEGIVALFFWDLDFTIPLADLGRCLGLTDRDKAGAEGQAFSIAAGLLPHPDELTLNEVEAPQWVEIEERALFRAGCGTYPASDEE